MRAKGLRLKPPRGVSPIFGQIHSLVRGTVLLGSHKNEKKKMSERDGSTFLEQQHLTDEREREKMLLFISLWSSPLFFPFSFLFHFSFVGFFSFSAVSPSVLIHKCIGWSEISDYVR